MSRLSIEHKISHLLESSVLDLFRSLDKEPQSDISDMVFVNIPSDNKHGDLTTNISMRLTKQLRMNPIDMAERIRGFLMARLCKSKIAEYIESIDVVKPGFLNIWFSNKFLHKTLEQAKKEGARFGSNQEGKNKSVQIEFVSANPTGPLTVAHGRQAAVGDALSRVMKFCGYMVEKEYFINDEGRQINVLGRSILYHYLAFYGVGMEFPEDGYRGDYIKEISGLIVKESGDKFVKGYERHINYFCEYGVRLILDIIKKDLKSFDVGFDSWFSQKKLTKNIIDKAIEDLRKKGFVYDRDNATWFNSIKFGDEKDRVIVKSDGAFTYFAPDIAYHLNKYKRGFELLINIWGPDHHGYIPRLSAACQAMGKPKESLSVLIVQLATIYRAGQAISMSTRKGEFLSLREVFHEVGKDVAKFVFLMRKLDSHLDFDLDIAKKQSHDNPVYYVQYAHARIWSIIGFSDGIKEKMDTVDLDLDLLKEPEEKELSRLVLQFPVYVRDSAINLEPYYIIVYLNNLAKMFHNFYTKHRVVTDDLSLSKARLFLVDCVRICLANGLNLVGVSLPKRM